MVWACRSNAIRRITAPRFPVGGLWAGADMALAVPWKQLRPHCVPLLCRAVKYVQKNLGTRSNVTRVVFDF